MKIGTYTRTNVSIAYMDGLVDKALIEEATTRLE
ncbi:hypothetical protein [Bacillus sp. SD075]|nr:hypothetical protein [Bacillus sp. SD075]